MKNAVRGPVYEVHKKVLYLLKQHLRNWNSPFRGRGLYESLSYSTQQREEQFLLLHGLI